MRSAIASVARVIVISRAKSWLAWARLRQVSNASRTGELKRCRRLLGPRPTLARRFKTRCSRERHPSRVEDGTPCGATEAESISKPTQLYAPPDAMSRAGTRVIAHYTEKEDLHLVRVRGALRAPWGQSLLRSY